MKFATLIFACFLVTVTSLKCGILSGDAPKAMQELTSVCIQSSKTNQSETNSSVEHETSKGGGNLSTTEINASKSSSENKNHSDLKSNVTNENQRVTTTFDDTKRPENCTLQCLWENLQMTDDKGFPDQAKIFRSLVKLVDEDEVKDFFEDSVNSCFQNVTQNDNICKYSTEIFKCLAVKGKFNCTDWPDDDSVLDKIL